MSKLIVDLASTSAVSVNPFMFADGLVNFDAIAKLQVKVAAALKATEKTAEAAPKIVGTYVTKRRAKPVRYSAALTAKGDHKYLVARATKIVLRKRITPEALARVAVLLQVADLPKLNAQLKQAQTAITRHQAKCETVLGKVTKEKGKLREVANKTFEKSIQMLYDALIGDTSGTVKDSDIVEAMGMMGSSLIVKLGPDNYVTVNKSDKARFAAAVKAAKEAPAA